MHGFRLPTLLGIALIALSFGTDAAVFRGQTAAGANYRIETPANWQAGDGLVIFNRGFNLDPISTDPSLGPDVLKQRMLQQGYAVAASSFSLSGWATFQTRTDLRELLQAVQSSLGQNLTQIGPLFLTGGSMGGLISVQQAELIARGEIPGISSAKGVLSLCPPLAGSAVWDQAMDFRLAYDAICVGSGGNLPSGPTNAPWLIRPSQLQGGGSAALFVDIATSAAQCIGFELPEIVRTQSMRTRRSKLLAATGVSEDFLAQHLFYATLAVSDLVYDPKKLGGLSNVQPFESRGVDYGDATLNNSIRRLSADPLSRFELRSLYIPDGRIGAAKLLTVATSGDGLVVPEHLRFLEGKTPTLQWARALVQETEPSHCGFTETELLASWEQLRDWSLGTTSKPSVASLNQRCNAVSTTSDTCRFASAENLAPLSTHIKARTELLTKQPEVDGGINGDWYTPSRSGEGLRIEALPDGRGLVSFFTYPKSGELAEQMWLTGTGKITENGITIDDVYRTSGPKFGAAFNTNDLRVERWGSLRVALTECGKAALSFTGPAGFGSETRLIQQLSRQKVPCFSRQAQQADTGLSGNWYEPTRSGEGVVLTVQNDLTVSMSWFTYTPTGEQAWFAMQAPLQRAAGVRRVTGTLLRPVGTRFGVDFQSSALRILEFGTVEFEFRSCNQLTLRAQTPWGVTEQQLVRLTSPIGTNDCQSFN